MGGFFRLVGGVIGGFCDGGSFLSTGVTVISGKITVFNSPLPRQ
jgi:hypothetical protein